MGAALRIIAPASLPTTVAPIPARASPVGVRPPPETRRASDHVDAMRQERPPSLRALGVPHPSDFIQEVWTDQWELGIDRLLNSANLRIRSLEPTDFHFKWALGVYLAA